MNIVEQKGWLVFNVSSLGVNRERKSKTSGRTLWITLSNPDENIRVAYPKYPGTGTQPEGTLALIEVSDILTQLFKLADTVLDGLDNEEKNV